MVIMARPPKKPPEHDEDTVAEWPVIRTYTDKNGIFVRVYKTAWAAASSNKFSVRPKGITL